ncbi:MAG TPA: SRPBCC family protein [Actinomycetes bacterium]|nr:SRPBCC family protein [Actinomycetes bacterium]
MAKLTNTFDLDLDAIAAWRVVGDIADAASWVPGVVSARFDGTVRTCTTADGAEIMERISDRSDRDMSFRYEHLATPAPVRGSHGILRVRSTGTGCRVEWDAEFIPADPAHAAEITAAMAAAFGQAAQSLQNRIESAAQPGRPARSSGLGG